MSEQRGGPTAALGAAIAIGAGIGTTLFALSGNPVWIGVGAGSVILLWLAWDRRPRLTQPGRQILHAR